MDRITYDDLTKNPQLMAGILERARRERSAAIYRYIVAPVLGVLRAVRLKPAPRGLKYHRA